MHEQTRSGPRKAKQGEKESHQRGGEQRQKQTHGQRSQKEMALSQERLKELLHYDPITGIFTWKIATSRRVKAGDSAGFKSSNEYVQIRIDTMLFQAHRLAWFYVHGYFPPFDVDHRNHNKHDNKLKNLRIGNRTQNSGNQILPHKRNKIQLLGVSWHKQHSLWRAVIMLNGKQKHLGLFNNPKDAQAAYVAAKRKLHEFNVL